MRLLNLSLLVLNIIVGAWAVFRHCVKRDGFECNHVLTFTLGFLVYWIFPIGVGLAGIMRDNPAMSLWYSTFDRVSAERLTGYLAITLVVYIAFLAGDYLGRLLAMARPQPYRRIFFYKRLLSLPFVLGIVLGLAYVVVLRDQLFRGYKLSDLAEASDINRGSFISVSIFLLGIALIYTLKRAEDAADPERAVPSFLRTIRNPYMAIYGIFALLVLSLGGRLYMLSSLVMLLVFCTCYFRRLPMRRAGVLTILSFAVFGLIGIGRQSQDYSVNRFLVIAMAEPMFTSFSLVHFLSDNAFEPLKFPVFLLSEFLNLIPSALLPNKLDMTLDPNNFGYIIYSPGGALNSFFSFMINFGVLGTVIAMAACGALLAYLRARDANLIHRAFYIMLCGWVGFTFFRDPFFISIVKTMLEFSIFVPLALVIGTQALSLAFRSTVPPGPSVSEPLAP